jgi:hypothetical protein
VSLRMNTLLVCGITLFVGLALFFWTAANLTHVNCCSQEWVNGAPDTVTRDVRTEVRAKSVMDTAKLKRQSQVYSLFCLAGAASLATLYHRRNRAPYSKRKRVLRTEC